MAYLTHIFLLSTLVQDYLTEMFKHDFKETWRKYCEIIWEIKKKCWITIIFNQNCDKIQNKFKKFVKKKFKKLRKCCWKFK